MAGDPPILDIGPFSNAFLADPFTAVHAVLREAGPVVRLSHYGIWVVARHAEAPSAGSGCRVKRSDESRYPWANFRWSEPYRRSRLSGRRQMCGGA